MVLPNAGNSSFDGFPNDPSPPEQDVWSSSTHSRFDPTLLPQPLPGIGFLLGFSARAVRARAETTIQFAESSIRRRMSPEESQAFAHHIYQLERMKSQFAGAGSAIGIWRWYATWNRMKYPFYQPKLEKIDSNKFAFFRGPSAQIARQTWRFAVYFMAAGFVGNIIGRIYSQPLAAIRAASDPKLQQFTQDVKAMGVAEIAERAKQAQERLMRRTEQDPSHQNGKDQVASIPSGERDPSPTAWGDAWSAGSASNSREESPFDPVQQDSRQQHTSQRRQAHGQAEPWGQWPSSGQSVPPSSPPSYDDESPTGGFFQDEALGAQSPSKSSENAWDRLRRGGNPPPTRQPMPPRERRVRVERKDKARDASGEDPFTFSDDQEERVEREQAQREFDARVERERQGRDFDEEHKRW